jgi:hypothetical protein
VGVGNCFLVALPSCILKINFVDTVVSNAQLYSFQIPSKNTKTF